MTRIARYARDQRGATALEFGLIAPAFCALVLGSLQSGNMLWTQLALQHATERAARYASLSSTCGTAATIQAYAASQALSRSLPAGAFSPSSQACGCQVSGSSSNQFLTFNVSLHATACFPHGS